MEVGSRLEGSYSQALNIWIDRHRTAMGVIRDMEDREDAIRRVLDTSSADLDDGQKLTMINELLATEEESHEGHSHG